jgi:BlaI family penicillinase repressor
MLPCFRSDAQPLCGIAKATNIEFFSHLLDSYRQGLRSNCDGAEIPGVPLKKSDRRLTMPTLVGKFADSSRHFIWGGTRTIMAPADPNELPSLSPGQLEIMDVIWRLGEATVAEVWRALSARRKVARNTVLTTLARLEEKGWLARKSDAHAHVYSATVPRETTLGTMLDQLVETAFGGSAEGLVMTLLQGRKISKDETARLRALIDEAEARSKGRVDRRAKS